MNQTELTLAVAAALVVAVMLGALLAWIAGRLNRPGPRAAALARDAAARLAAAETAQTRAEARLARVEADLSARLLDAETELAATHARLERARAQADEIRDAYREATRGRAP